MLRDCQEKIKQKSLMLSRKSLDKSEVCRLKRGIRFGRPESKVLDNFQSIVKV